MPKLDIMDYKIFSKHPEWSAVAFIIKTLNDHGHQAVLAGGCVRDALRGVLAKDLDVATDAKPEHIESYFSKVLPIGKSFGVCRVVHSGASIEVATFRQEFDYLDGRRPQRIEYSDLEKDAQRRDFTINALFYDLAKGQVIDTVGGIDDLKKKILKCVGDPEKRLNEDYLRLLRGVRFAGQFDFSIEEKTALALKKARTGLTRISRERIYDELNKMFVPAGIKRCYDLMQEYRLLETLFPNWNFFENVKFFDQDVSLETLMASLSEAETKNPVFGWALLYHLRCQQQSQKLAEKEFLSLKLPKQTLEVCRAISRSRELVETSGDLTIVALIRLVVSGYLPEVETYWKAIDKTHQFSRTLEDLKLKYFTSVSALEGEYSLTLPEPLVNGDDLLRRGDTAGPKMKHTLQALYIQQLKNKSLSKQHLLDMCKS